MVIKKTKDGKEYDEEYMLDEFNKLSEAINKRKEAIDEYNSACADLESALEDLEVQLCDYNNIEQEWKGFKPFEELMKREKIKWLEEYKEPEYGEQIKEDAE